MIYQEKLQIKLDAILAKDVDAIYNEHPCLPILNNTYTKVQLKNWLNKVAKVLSDAKEWNQTQLDNYKNTIYNSLSAANRVYADKILNGEFVDLGIFASTVYDKMVALSLYYFITTP